MHLFFSFMSSASSLSLFESSKSAPQALRFRVACLGSPEEEDGGDGEKGGGGDEGGEDMDFNRSEFNIG
jgi:hypothetical protein